LPGTYRQFRSLDQRGASGHDPTAS